MSKSLPHRLPMNVVLVPLKFVLFFLGRLCQREGRLAVIRDELHTVYNWFSEGVDTADLRAARALLDEPATPHAV